MRLWHEIGLLPMKRHPDPLGRLFRRHPRKHHLIEGQSQRIRGRPINADDPALHRTIIAPIKNRRSDPMRPPPGNRNPRDNKSHAKEDRARGFARP